MWSQVSQLIERFRAVSERERPMMVVTAAAFYDGNLTLQGYGAQHLLLHT